MDEDELIAAIMAFYGDTSRSREHTREGLENAQEQIKLLLTSLEDDE